MKVKDLIVELQKQDPEKEVMIQQGEEFDYMRVYTVREKKIFKPYASIPEDCVVIEYQ